VRIVLFKINFILSLGISLFFVMVSPSVNAVDQTADVIIETKFGDIEIRLLSDVAPKHVENFLNLSESGFYDGTIFHRVIPGFMIQGGDPNTKGTDKSIYGQGGPDHKVKAEFNILSHVRGIVSMARSSHPDSAGSQFFIVVKDSKFLDGQYTVFGEVVSGMDVADKIVSQKRDARDNPLDRIEMKIRIRDSVKEVAATENK
jgi:peptidyl-prolyl cis-trans isomerase B (cyclophilin B)